jgi:hypothetical protein
MVLVQFPFATLPRGAQSYKVIIFMDYQICPVNDPAEITEKRNAHIIPRLDRE